MQSLGSPPINCGAEFASSRAMGANDLKRDII
jgi:hypothetical protein